MKKKWVLLRPSSPSGLFSCLPGKNLGTSFLVHYGLRLSQDKLYRAKDDPDRSDVRQSILQKYGTVSPVRMGGETPAIHVDIYLVSLIPQEESKRPLVYKEEFMIVAPDIF